MAERKNPRHELQRFVIYTVVSLFAIHSLSAISILYLVGAGYLNLSNSLLLSLLGSTFGEAAGIFLVIARYLFPK